VVALAAWELASRAGLIQPIMFSSPSRVAAALVDGFRSGEFLPHLRATLTALAWGYLIGAAVGIVVGFAAGLTRRSEQSLSPVIAIVYSTPVVALIPLIIIWFGFGMPANVFIVAVGVGLQVAISTKSGLTMVDARHLRVANSYGASWRQRFWRVILPSARPLVLTGLQLGVGRGLMAVVAMELLASNAGLGFYIARASATFQAADIFAGMILIAALGIVGTAAVGMVHRRVERWRPPVSRDLS
jgi:sulfonate transport system permease protein